MKELKGIVLEHTRDKGFVCVCVCFHCSSFQLIKIKKKKFYRTVNSKNFETT